MYASISVTERISVKAIYFLSTEHQNPFFETNKLFSSTRFTGKSFANFFRGSYETSDTLIHVNPLMITDACPCPA